MRLLAICLLLGISAPIGPAVAAEKLQEFRGATFVKTAYNDGDSFRVRYLRNAKPEEEVLRLYFVDAFESISSANTDKRRLLEQTREFGFAKGDRERGVQFGKRAAERVAELLSEPFTLHTAFALAPGRSRKPRIYGMVTTAKGEDLAAILVREGLARVKGFKHKRPDGQSGKEYEELLKDLQLKAAVERRGAWKVTDVDHLPEIREEQRKEERELQALGEPPLAESDLLIDLNTATEEELDSLEGIGPSLAHRIVEQRPYKSVDDLKRVPGISPSKLEKLRPHVWAGDAANSEDSKESH
jgi:competence protein ComEA